MRFFLISFVLVCSQFLHAQWLKNLVFEEKINTNRDTLNFKMYHLQDQCRYTFKGETSLPFFCKIEDKIEKKSQIPFKMRLGSLNYVDYLENKSKNMYFYGQN